MKPSHHYFQIFYLALPWKEVILTPIFVLRIIKFFNNYEFSQDLGGGVLRFQVIKIRTVFFCFIKSEPFYLHSLILVTPSLEVASMLTSKWGSSLQLQLKLHICWPIVNRNFNHGCFFQAPNIFNCPIHIIIWK